MRRNSGEELDFSLVDGGINAVDDPSLLEKNQVQPGTINAILTKGGWLRRPGMIGYNKVDTVWEEFDSSFDANPIMLAVSDNGQYIICGTATPSLSNDYGKTWHDISAGNGRVVSCAISGSGQYLLLATSGDFVYVSTDFGNSWTQKVSSAYGYWCVISKDGQYQAITDYTSHKIWLSSDYGANWNAVISDTSAYISLSMSDSGQHLLASGQSQSGVYFIKYSSDYGVTWNIINHDALPMYQTAISQDGSIFFATRSNKDLLMSIDSGVTWTVNSSYPDGLFLGKQSDDGSFFLGDRDDIGNSHIFKSINNGNDWVIFQTTMFSRCVCNSRNGNTVVVGNNSRPLNIFKNISTALPIFDGAMRGLSFYKQDNGAETLIPVVDGKIYSFNTETAAIAELYNITGMGNASIKSFQNKCWIANGSGFVKIESDMSAYRVGIQPPDNINQMVLDGGTLPIGVYNAFAGYYRVVNGLKVLFSYGAPLQRFELTTGHQAIRIVIPQSIDPQVAGTVVWMTDANGQVYYVYATSETLLTGQYIINIVSDANKDVTQTYNIQGIENLTPKNFTNIEIADRRIWGVDPINTRNFWYSLRAVESVYDLERFPSSNYLTMDFTVISLHALGQNLFINTHGGLYRLPSCDPNIKIELVDPRYYFIDANVVCSYGGFLIGLTNDGVRIFDGNSFSPDLTEKIKPIITSFSNGLIHAPCAVIGKRNIRTEYHLCYRDDKTGMVNNNRRLILNLDTISIQGADAVSSWEVWDNGAEYLAVNSNHAMYSGQHNDVQSNIYKENEAHSTDQFLFDDIGVFYSDERKKTTEIITRVNILSPLSRTKYVRLRVIAHINGEILGAFYPRGSIGGRPYTFAIDPRYGVISITGAEFDHARFGQSVFAKKLGGGTRFGHARFGQDKFISDMIQEFIVKLPMNMNDYGCFIKLYQVADDISFQMIRIAVDAYVVTGRYV